MQKTWGLRIVILALLVAAVSLIRSTVGQGTDFLVFYKAGRALLGGVSFYNVAQEGGMVFKYPPWIVPFFAPIAFFGFETAKWIWGAFCVLCMAGIFRWLEVKQSVQKQVWIPLAISYWGLWVIHALDGQIMIPILCFGLWASGSARGLVPVFYSTKIFTLYPLLFNFKSFLKPKILLTALLVVFSLSWFSAARSFNHDFASMFQEWKVAATSGSTHLDSGQTRGPKNQSITSWICRNLDVPVQATSTEVAVSLSLYAVAFFVFRRRLKGRSMMDAFLAGMALTPVFHPLPWHHLYVWTFPVAALSLQRWKNHAASRSRVKTALLFLALFLITFSSERAFGLIEAIRPVGAFLEWNVGRAWGALLLVIVFTQNE